MLATRRRSITGSGSFLPAATATAPGRLDAEILREDVVRHGSRRLSATSSVLDDEGERHLGVLERREADEPPVGCDARLRLCSHPALATT